VPVGLSRHLGPLTIGVLVIGYVVLWLVARPAGETLSITADMSCATSTCSLKLHWQSGTEGAPWNVVEMQPLPDAPPIALLDGMLASQTRTYTAVIPAEAVTTDGLQYYLEGSDAEVTTFAPGTSYLGAYLPVDGQMVTTFPVLVLERS